MLIMMYAGSVENLNIVEIKRKVGRMTKGDIIDMIGALERQIQGEAIIDPRDKKDVMFALDSLKREVCFATWGA